MTGERVGCRTPNPDKPGVTNIPAWKFDAVRDAIRDVIGSGEIRWSDLTEAVRTHLTQDQLERMGNLGWHVVTVKLEMEVRGEIARVPGVSPQVLRGSGPA